MYVIGIDPGLDGGIALVTPSYNMTVVDPPTLNVKGKGKGAKNKRLYHVSEIVKLLKFWAEQYNPLRCYIENVHSMPGQGVVAMFSMGRGLGMYEGILHALEIPFEYVTPQAWKKLMLSGQNKEKDASVYKAMQLFPGAELKTLRGRLLDGRAEALLIAEYGRRINMVGRPVL